MTFFMVSWFIGCTSVTGHDRGRKAHKDGASALAHLEDLKVVAEAHPSDLDIHYVSVSEIKVKGRGLGLIMAIVDDEWWAPFGTGRAHSAGRDLERKSWIKSLTVIRQWRRE